MLITIEGVDGAGKHTLARGLCDAWTDSGLEVLSMGFPRYGESMHADLAAEALQGEHGDLASSVYGMAAMFALDRHDAARDLRRLINRTDIVLLDRYAASNAAYSAARLHESAQGKVVAWVKALEFERFAIPVPDVQLLLNIPVAVAAARAKSREQLDATRRRDSYELDGDLQQRTADVYSALAAANWVSPWRVVEGDVDTTQLAAQLVNKPTDQVEVTP